MHCMQVMPPNNNITSQPVTIFVVLIAIVCIQSFTQFISFHECRLRTKWLLPADQFNLLEL